MFHVLTKRLQPQKKRSYRFLATQPNFNVNQNFLNKWLRYINYSKGLISWRLVEKIYIWGKKLTRYPYQKSKFWVNLQCSYVFTRKAKNTRMGKGKGSNAGRRTKINSGSIIIAFSSLRSGQLYRLLRQIRVRCPLNIGISGYQSNHNVYPSFLKFKKNRRRYARLASARAWNKTKKYKQQRIFEFISLVFFWLQKKPKLDGKLLFFFKKSLLTGLRYQTLTLFSSKLFFVNKWLWASIKTLELFKK